MRFFLLSLSVFLPLLTALSVPENPPINKSSVTRKPVVFIVTAYGETDEVIKAWNQRLGKSYDIVSDAPLSETFRQIEKTKIGARAWMSPSFSAIKKETFQQPENLEWVFYDFERWDHTPKAEKANVAKTSRALREYSLKRNWKTCFIPIYRDALSLAPQLAPYYDAYIVQCQKYQTDEKRAQTVAYLQSVEREIHKLNPNCLVGCQLGSLDKYGNGEPFGGVKSALSLYEETQDFLNIYSIWWAPDADRMIELLDKMEQLHIKSKPRNNPVKE
jgi:hypothetical protein